MSAALIGPRIAYGPTAERFEREVASRLGLDQGVALSSGTAALHLALIAVGVGEGDFVPMPTLTFVAPAHAASYVGAKPLFFDAEPHYRQLDTDHLITWLQEQCESDGKNTIHRKTGRRIGAIVAVDLLGHLCDLELLSETARRLGIPLIEDAAQGLGATLRGRPVGTNADVTCLSFNANKLVTSGGGGMLLTKHEKMIDEVRSLANQAKEEGPDYVHDKVGFNYRLAAAQAALGLAQFKRIEEFIERKCRVARYYEEALADVPGVTMPRCAPEATVTNWLFTVHIDPEQFGCTSHQLMKLLDERHRVESRPIFTPLHARGVYAGGEAEPCPVAEGLAATGLSLPSSVALSEEQLERVCEGIRSAAAARA